MMHMYDLICNQSWNEYNFA